MGIILDFATAPRRLHRPKRAFARRIERDADVIIFPGIRIERQTLDLSARIGRKLDRAAPILTEHGPRA